MGATDVIRLAEKSRNETAAVRFTSPELMTAIWLEANDKKLSREKEPRPDGTTVKLFWLNSKA